MEPVASEGLCTVLVVSDDCQVLEQTQMLLEDAGIRPVIALADSRATLSFLEQHKVSLIILEMTPELNRADYLSRIRADYPKVQIIVQTEISDVEIAVDSMKSGAVDFIVRPYKAGRLLRAVENALNFEYSQLELSSLKEYLLNDRLEHGEVFSDIKTACRKMRSLFQYTEIVACSHQPVMITGETGVGKELFARAIHRISGVRGQFVSINVAGLDDAMFSDTLFGHKKGAFTGAEQYRDGLVSKAAMGTLFLDEIGDLNELSQVKLLRLLQEREYYPVGADLIKTSSARIVLATNVNLLERIKEGRFRRDLYYRLCTHQIHIPALRERREDIPILLEAFIKDAAQRFGMNIPTVDPEIVQAITEYDFLGNVRELQARVSDAVARHTDGVLTLDDFHGIFAAAQQHTSATHAPAIAAGGIGVYGLFNRLPTFREIEDYLILEALKLSEGNFAVAASILGVTRQTISKRLKSISTLS